MRALRVVGRWARRLATVVGAVVLVSGLTGLLAGLLLRPAAPTPPDGAILIYDMTAAPIAVGAADPIAADLLGRADAPLTRDLLALLDAAAADPRVSALQVRLRTGLPLAQAQELRGAIERFRASGKPAALHARGFGGGPGGLVFASAFERVAIDPIGEVGYAGIALDQPFAGAALDRVGIEAQIVKRKAFKSAADAVARAEQSAVDREQMTALADGWAGQVAAAVAAGRGMSVDAAVAALDAGPHLAADALALRLVDERAYWVDVEAALDAGRGFDLAAYAAGLELPEAAATIAFVPVVGPIVGGGEADPFGGDIAFGYALEETLRAVAEDDDFDAVLLFVDSPGGAYPAANAVREGVAAVKAAGKPVIALMGGVAASGGYFAAMGADAIFARPATITGSIGVVTGKMNFAGLWDLLDIAWAQTTAGGPNAGALSPNRGFTDPQWAKLNAAADAIYDDFVGKAAADRGMAVDAMERLARGRIWTGAAAAESGLIDGVGGFAAAQAALRGALDLDAAAALAFRDAPAPPDAFEALSALIAAVRTQSAAVARLASAANRLVGGARNRLAVPVPPAP